MRPEGSTKRQQAAVTNAPAEGDDGTSRKRKKSEPTLKEEVADEERALNDFDTVYDYLENTKSKYEFEDFATLKEQYVSLLVQPGDDYTRQHGAETGAVGTRKGRRRTAKLPKHGGIFFEDIPLHHRRYDNLHPLEQQRLKSCGLFIRKWKKWTREEDEFLVDNWREYAARHDVPLRDAPKFFGITGEELLELRERKQEMQATLFRPWMCKRLLHRTCKQSHERARVLFHPNYRLRGGNEMWTADDDELLLRLVKAHNGNYKEIALQMGRIREHCKERYYWLRKHGAANDGTVLNDFLREVLPCNPVKFVRSEEFVGFEHGIDWYAASEQTGKSATECRMKWVEFKEYILEQASNGRRKKEILPGLLQLTGALKQRAKAARRKWTVAETQRLVGMVAEMGRCWVKIARELNREPKACMQRYYDHTRLASYHAGEWTPEELQRFYNYLVKELGWHPVEAARRRGGDHDLFWPDVANATGKSMRDCQNMWKRLKVQFAVSQQHLQTDGVFKIAEHALQSCLVQVKKEPAERDEAEALEDAEPPAEAVCEEAEDGENVAPAPPPADVTPSQLSHCITILLKQDVLESKKDFDADWLRRRRHDMPSLASRSDDVVRHVRRMLRRCKRAGMFARLPEERRTLRGKLKALEFVLSRTEELLVPSLRFRKRLKKFAEQGEFKLLPRDDASEEPDFVDLRLPSSAE